MNNDLISRSALLESFGEEPIVWDSRDREDVQMHNDWLDYTKLVKEAPAVDAVEVDAVAQMLYESFGDPCACDFNGNDEWLPMVCDNMNECPDVKDELFCWKQFIKHYGERGADNAD